MKHPDYHTATNAAYEILTQMPKYTPDVDVFYIAQNIVPNCKIMTYAQACFFYPLKRELLMENSSYGFTIRKGGKRIILFNEMMPYSSIRFTLGHEIGHAALKHRSADEKGKIAEKEANCFSRNLLCPFVFAEKAGARSPREYSDIFNVSQQMASVSISNIPLDQYHISEKNRIMMEDLFDAYMMGFGSLFRSMWST